LRPDFNEKQPFRELEWRPQVCLRLPKRESVLGRYRKRHTQLPRSVVVPAGLEQNPSWVANGGKRVEFAGAFSPRDRLGGSALFNTWNRLNVATRQVAGEWGKSAEAEKVRSLGR
jgi:hypothetical protein